MARFCSFCGMKFTVLWPLGDQPIRIPGYDLCERCHANWQASGRVDYLLKNGVPEEIFHIDGAKLNSDSVKYKYEGKLIFFENAIAFLASSRKKKSNVGTIGMAGGGALGAVLAGAIQDKLEKRSEMKAIETDSIREALKNAIGLLVIKRKDLKCMTYSFWKGFTIETLYMMYNEIWIDKKTFQQSGAKIAQYMKCNRAEQEADIE